MSKKYPNASMLSLITQTNLSNEKLLFIYLKAVPDYHEKDDIIWFEKAGKNGIPNKVWENLSINQWVAFGKDDKIIELFESILNNKSIIIEKKTINFDVPALSVNNDCSDKDQFISTTKYDSLKIIDDSFIPQEFYQKENLQFLSGYKLHSSTIKPLFPLGFYEDNFIHKNLCDGIWGIKEYRTAYLTFHGVKNSSKKGIGSKEMEGFYQQNFDKEANYSVVLKNEDENEVGKNTIDIKTGFFHIDLKESIKGGKIEVLFNDKEEKQIDFVLIQDIKFDMNIASKSFTDVYGRNFMISDKDKKRPDKIQNFTWQQEVYQDIDTANQKLSDLFKLVFDYLGPKILIADPYFVGNITIDNTTNSISLLEDQKAMINAIAHSYHEKGLETIEFI